MKIVVLDGRALNPGDLSWMGLEALGEVSVYNQSTSEEVIVRAKDAEILLTNKTVLNKELLSQLDHCKYIGVMASGYNVVDTEYAKSKGIIVTNVPNYSTPTVAQHVFALLLEAYVHVGKHDSEIKNNAWASSKDFTYYQPPFMELHQKTMGIVGFGNIGKAVAKIAISFGMNVLLYDKGKIGFDPLGTKVSLETLLSESDVVSLHLPLKEETKHIIDSSELAMMKPTACLINTARAQLIKKESLLIALSSKQIATYCADVFDPEPPMLYDPLIMNPKTIFTGHMAWASKEARTRCLTIIERNIEAYQNNQVINQVN
jgi:glycerate dehydrogenase